MSKRMSSEELQSFLLQSSKSIANLLKTVSHSRRLEILARLLYKNKSFSELLEETNLQKTALANHLTLLLNRDLIERIERGRYRITEDGYSIIQSITEVYHTSLSREIDKQIELMKHYSRRYTVMNEKELEEKKVSRIPEYQHCWVSYLGAVSGILKSLGKDYDVVDIGGYTGWSFLVNVSKGATCPSGPTAHNAYPDILKATERLGFTIESFEDNESFPLKEGEITEEDRKRAMKLLIRIKSEIDNNDKPVVLWGIPVPEYGIVYGYEGDSYIVSTFRHLTDQPETPIKYYDLQAPGCLQAIFFGEETPGLTEDDDKDAINRAIKMAEGISYAPPKYVAGPEAFDEWANVLEKESSENVPYPYHGNSYVGECTREGKEITVAFLKRLSEKYKGKLQSNLLIEALNEYKKAEELMKQFVTVFPFAFQGDMSKEKRKKGADILRKVKPHVIKAIEYLKESYKKWE